MFNDEGRMGSLIPQGKRPLTPRQAQILEWIRTFLDQHGLPPTLREIGTAFDMKSSSVFQFIEVLERKGCLKRGTLGARSLIVKGVGRRHPRGIVEVPVVGRIAAGRPIEAIECEAGTVIVSEDLVGRGPAFALKIEGNSMVEDGILDGDCVVVRKQETANNGDIVVALIEGEATLKRFYRERGGVRLEPANRRLAPIHVSAGDFRIQGRAVAVLRAL